MQPKLARHSRYPRQHEQHAISQTIRNQVSVFTDYSNHNRNFMLKTMFSPLLSFLFWKFEQRTNPLVKSRSFVQSVYIFVFYQEICENLKCEIINSTSFQVTILKCIAIAFSKSVYQTSIFSRSFLNQLNLKLQFSNSIIKKSIRKKHLGILLDGKMSLRD